MNLWHVCYVFEEVRALSPERVQFFSFTACSPTLASLVSGEYKAGAE